MKSQEVTKCDKVNYEHHSIWRRTTKEGSAAYEEARELGRTARRARTCRADWRLHRHDGSCLTRRIEAGGHVIGVTCQDIEEWRGSAPING